MARQINMPEVTDEVLRGIVERITRRFVVHKIILFGSRAWGRPGASSDIDILVIMDSDDRPAERAAEISLAARPKFMPMDVIARTPDEISERLAIGDFFIRRILEQGRVLFER